MKSAQPTRVYFFGSSKKNFNMQYKALPKAGLVLQLNLVGKLTKYTKSFTLKWALYLTFSWVGRPITSLGGATELRIYLKLNFQ